MTTALFFAGAFILCLMTASRGLRQGLLSLIAIGYV